MHHPRAVALVLTTVALLSAGCAPAATPSVQPSPSPASAIRPTPTTLPVLAEHTTRQPLTRTPIPPVVGRTVSFDAMEIDQAANRLYITDRGDQGVDVFDVSTSTPKYLQTITLGVRPSGLSIATDRNTLYIGNNDSTVAVIDINPASASANTIVATINTGGPGGVDLVEYDPKDRKVYAANADDCFISAIDATTNAVVKKIDHLGGALEQPRYDPGDGMLYLTGSDDNVIYQIDPTRDELVRKFDVGVPCAPHGLAINPGTNQALLGCGNREQQHTLAWDLEAGKVLATFDQVGAGDLALYDAKADRFFFAAANFYRGGQVGIFSGSPIQFLTNVPTAVGSNGIAYDETNRIVYTADRTPGQAALLSFQLPGS